MNTPHPIEIVGGGLAGLSLGLALRRHQIPVTLYEAGEYPRHRVCGEFITGLDAKTIAHLGLEFALHDALRHREVAWFAGPGAPEVYALPSPALGLSRHTLDARLATAFTSAGGVLRTRTRRTDLDTAAAGRVLANGRRAGPAGRSAWLGLKVHVRGLSLHRDLELHLGDQSYIGLATVEHGAVNACGLFRRRPLARRGPELLLEYLRACGLDALAARLRAAEIVSESFCAVAALAFDRRVPTRDRLALGDACAMIPPFTGNGMAMAFQSAEAALDPLVRYSRGETTWVETCRATNRALRGRFRVRLAAADLVHPFLLRPRQQRWFSRLSRARLLPFRSLYAALH